MSTSELVVTLVPLIVASAIIPSPLVITTLLLRAPAGRTTAVAWTAGMTTMRLLQGLVFGLLFEGIVGSGGDAGPGRVASAILVVLALLFYVVAVRKLVNAPDEDAPPPGWLARLQGVTPGRAFAMGFGLLLISVKFWVLTLGAIGVITEADLGGGAAVAVYLAFIVLAQSLQLGILGIAYLAPSHAEVWLGRFSALLERYNRPIVIAIGLIFGTWFLLKGLLGLGVIG